MKKIFTSLTAFFLLLITHLVQAQATEGIITFETKINMHRRLAPEQEAMKNMVPEFRTSKQVLLFNTHESLWKPAEEEEDDLDVMNDGMRMRIRTPKFEIYNNQALAKRTSLREIMGKPYLVADSIRILPWKLTDLSKTILGYPCKQARHTDETNKTTVVAWYTDKLRAGLGPENYNSLPGTVLEVDVNNGERLLKALKVETRSLKKGELSEPSKGQKINEKAFQDLMAEQRKRMGGHGNVIIRN